MSLWSGVSLLRTINGFQSWWQQLSPDFRFLFQSWTPILSFTNGCFYVGRLGDVFELQRNEHGVVIHWVALGQNTDSMNHAYHVTVDYINVIIKLPLYIKYEEVGGTQDQVCMCACLINNWWCEFHSMFLSQITAPCWDGDRFCIIDEVTQPDPNLYRRVRWNVSEMRAREYEHKCPSKQRQRNEKK